MAGALTTGRGLRGAAAGSLPEHRGCVWAPMMPPLPGAGPATTDSRAAPCPNHAAWADGPGTQAMTIASAALLLFLILDPWATSRFPRHAARMPPRRPADRADAELLIALGVLMLFLWGASTRSS